MLTTPVGHKAAAYFVQADAGLRFHCLKSDLNFLLLLVFNTSQSPALPRFIFTVLRIFTASERIDWAH